MEKKRISLFFIVHRPCCKGQIFMTTNPDVAERHSRNGCIVTCGGNVIGGKDES